MKKKRILILAGSILAISCMVLPVLAVQSDEANAANSDTRQTTFAGYPVCYRFGSPKALKVENAGYANGRWGKLLTDKITYPDGTSCRNVVAHLGMKVQPPARARF